MNLSDEPDDVAEQHSTAKKIESPDNEPSEKTDQSKT